MKIERLELRNLGPFEHANIEFQPCTDDEKADIHIFVGPNGSGKSTLLRALAACLGHGEGLMEPARRHNYSRDPSRKTATGAVITAAGERFGIGPNQPPEPLSQIFPSFRRERDVFDGWVFESARHGVLAENWQLQRRATPGTRLDPDTRVPFASFNYLARRLSVDVPPGPVGLELTPFAGTSPLLQWVANEKEKADICRRAGALEEAARYEPTVRRIEHAISDLFEQEMTFGFSRRDNERAYLVLGGREVLPTVISDGMAQILAWVADIFVKLDRIPWKEPEDNSLRPFIALIDEVELHLHPAWQRKILATVARLFPNAQFFVSTHSPQVIASASDAWIYPLRLEDDASKVGKQAVVGEPIPSQVGSSADSILREVMGLETRFSVEVEEWLNKFRQARNRRLGGDEAAQAELDAAAAQLSTYGTETRNIVGQELRQLARLLRGTS